VRANFFEPIDADVHIITKREGIPSAFFAARRTVLCIALEGSGWASGAYARRQGIERQQRLWQAADQAGFWTGSGEGHAIRLAVSTTWRCQDRSMVGVRTGYS
jgi:hypothetical protein